METCHEAGGQNELLPKPKQRTYIIGKMYEARKKSIGEHEGNQHTSKMERSQNDFFPKPKKKTYETIAEEIGVSEGTVQHTKKVAGAQNEHLPRGRKSK